MPRIAGIDLPDNKPTRVSLTYIYGIGPSNVAHILEKCGLDGQARAHTLTEDQLAKISKCLEEDFVIEGALRRQINDNIKRLREIKCYRGDRHRKGLPTRGQRTRTNARTRKGRKKTVAGKKAVKAK